MGEWGPGNPDLDLPRGEETAQESEEEDSDESPSAEGETQEERPQRRREESDGIPEVESLPTASSEHHYAERDWRDGTVDDVLSRGEYAFLPVFGFNEGHVAVRRFVERAALDEEDWWEEDGTEGKMFDDGEEPTRIDGKELSWWEDNSIMPKHPFMLVNPVGFTTADADARDFRDLFRVAKSEQFVFSDSGGYQLMSMDDARIVDNREEHEFQELDVYPEQLLEWQVHNADAGATIDFPPYNISGDANFPDAVKLTSDWEEFFERRRKKSADMTKRMAGRLRELRGEGDEEALDYIFTPVIHGKPHPKDTHRYVEQWHDEMYYAAENAGVIPRGWVLKPEPSHSFGQIAMHLGYASEWLVDQCDYIHVLMVGGLFQKTLLMYFAQNTDVMVTSDASSYAAGGKRRQFDLPKTARRRSVIITNRTDDEREDATMDAHRLDRYPCRCAVCSTVEREHGFEFVTEGTGSARNATLNLHNLHQALSVEQTLSALLREEDADIAGPGTEPVGSEFWRFMSTLTGEKRLKDLHRAMSYIEMALDEGLAAANTRYRILWDTSGGRTVVPASGSGAETDW